MKVKTMALLGLCCLSASVYANSSLPIKTLQSMYQTSVNNSNNDHYDDNALLKRHATAELKALIVADEKASEGEVGCIDHVVMWQGQDYEHHVKLGFKALSANRIQVNIGKGQWSQARNVIYQMQCSSNTCKIADVISQHGSLKKSLNRCLKS